MSSTDDYLSASDFFSSLFIGIIILYIQLLLLPYYYFVKDPNSLPDDSYGTFQLLFLLVVYGVIIILSALLMAGGSELLIFIPSISGYVASVIIPIIAQIIDAFIVIFSCLGANAQRELAIGVGALTGATVSMLSFGWFLGIYGGRVDLFVKTGMPNYYGNHKLDQSNHYNFQGTGIVIHRLTKVAVSFMVLTSLSYVIILFPNIVYASDATKTIAFEDRDFSLATFIACIIMLLYYIYYQISNSRIEDNANNLLRDELLRDSIKRKVISLLAIMMKDIEHDTKNGLIDSLTPIGSRDISRSATKSDIDEIDSTLDHETDSLMQKGKAKDRLSVLLKPFFDKYDKQQTGEIPIYCLHGIFVDIGELPPDESVIEIFMKYEQHGKITYPNIVDGLFEFLAHHDEIITSIAKGTSMVQPSATFERNKAELYEEVSEFPQDIVEMSPNDQKSIILRRGLFYIFFGLFLALFFSSALIDVMDALGTRFGISAFYVSFLFSPVVADLYSFILTYRYALRKTSKSITLSLVSLVGSVIVNNTMVFGVFMILIYTQDLAWIYLSETTIIISTEIIIGLYAVKNVHTFLDGCIILSWYPLSIVIIYIWNTYGLT